MRKNKSFIFFVGFFLVVLVFFHKSFFLHQVPFPGDLLIAEYAPWSTFSYFGYNPGSYPNKAQYFDTLRQIVPWKSLSVELLTQGVVPLWNPYNFSGSPLMANSQSSIWYPLSFLYFLFPFAFSWSLLVGLQIVLSLVFFYLYARSIGISYFASFFGSIAFSCSLFMTVFLEYNTIGHVILWMPLALFAIERIITQKKIRFLLLLIGSLISALLAGHIQVFGYSVLFIGIYTIARIARAEISKKEKLYISWYIVISIGLVMGITAFQTVPLFELIVNSARVSQNYNFLIDHLLLQPYQFVLFLIPDFFGNPATRNYTLADSYPSNAVSIGAASFFLAFFGFFGKRKNWFVMFYSCSIFVLYLVVTRNLFSELFYKIQIPLLSTGSPSNALFLLSFSLAVLAGFGIDNFLLFSKKKRWVVYGFCWAILIAVGVVTFTHSIEIQIKQIMFSVVICIGVLSILFCALVYPNQKNMWMVLLLFITVGELFYFFNKFNSFVPSQLVFPHNEVTAWLRNNGGINRFWGYGGGAVEANFSTIERIYSPDGYDPLYPKLYGEFIQLSKNGTMTESFTNVTRSDAKIASGYGAEKFEENVFRKKVLNFLGVRYILDVQSIQEGEKTFKQPAFFHKKSIGRWNIFENTFANERIFLTTEFEFYSDKKDFSKKFFSNQGNNKVYFERNQVNSNLLSHVVHKKENNLSVVIKHYTPNRIVVDTLSDSESILVLSDTYFPGWKAYVDSRQSVIIPVNHAFRSVVVGEGSHRVEFIYQPESFAWGIKISIISIVGLFMYLGILKRKNYAL